MNNKLSHINAQTGAAQMVDISEKPLTLRTAKASAKVILQHSTQQALIAGGGPKGEALATAKLAGVMAAKKTAELIPLCHSIGLDAIDIEIEPDGENAFLITATARVVARTGLEMEAMVGVSTAALTLYDMAKAIDKGITITDIKLLEKTGGKSGKWSSRHDG